PGGGRSAPRRHDLRGRGAGGARLEGATIRLELYRLPRAHLALPGPRRGTYASPDRRPLRQWPRPRPSRECRGAISILRAVLSEAEHFYGGLSVLQTAAPVRPAPQARGLGIRAFMSSGSWPRTSAICPAETFAERTRKMPRTIAP